MRIRRRYAVLVAVAAAGALAVAGIAIAASTTTSTYSFNISPNKVPKKKYKPIAFKTDLLTTYTNPGNAQPGGAVQRTQIYIDKNVKLNPKAAKKCSPQQLANQTMAGAMKNCKKALVGKGTATATANGAFTINGCVLLFNGAPQGGNPTLQVFTRVQASNPSKISCSNPSGNNQGNATILLNGVYKKASGKYGLVLDVNNIVAAATFPLEDFNTKIKKGNYDSARCKAKNKTWYSKSTWTYNNGAKHTEKESQKCKVKH
jgi:hypothetical protein